MNDIHLAELLAREKELPDCPKCGGRPSIFLCAAAPEPNTDHLFSIDHTCKRDVRVSMRVRRLSKFELVMEDWFGWCEVLKGCE